ncbi:MAG: helix-turn-helix transcriptional regulator [Mariniphaga sp.]
MNTIESFIRDKQKDNFTFKPDQKFYETVKINQKRWGQIYRGEVSPSIEEVKSISTFFNVPITEFIQ